VGRVLATLPEGRPVWGVTSLDSLLYVLRGFKLSEQIEVYDTDRYRFQRRLTVPGLGGGNDIVACRHNRCAYICDRSNKCIHRVELPHGSAVINWPVNDKPACLSVTGTHSVLVTCDKMRKIKEFSTDGKLVRQIQLPEDMVSPRHAVPLFGDKLVVCHDDRGEPAHHM